jgi:hypothetical protein
MTHAGDIHQLINVLATAPIGRTASPAKAGTPGFKAVIGQNFKPATTLPQLSKKYPKISFDQITRKRMGQPPADVVKGLDEWLSSTEGSAGFGLLKRITLEDDSSECHASINHIYIGEGVFSKGSKFFTSILNHEFEHVLDANLMDTHLKTLAATKSPAELKAILSNEKPVLLVQHYEKVLDSAAATLKDDEHFVSLITSAKNQTKNGKTHEVLDIFLSKEITLKSLGGLGHFLVDKPELRTIDKYLRMNYGIPSLYSFVSKSTNLNRVDPRLSQAYGESRIRIYPELSSTFAELTTQDMKEIYRLGTETARKNVAALLQLGYDSGKIKEEVIIEVTKKPPAGQKIYTGPTLLSL